MKKMFIITSLIFFSKCISAQEKQGKIVYVKNPGDPASEFFYEQWFTSTETLYKQKKKILDLRESPQYKNKRYSSMQDSLNDVAIINRFNASANQGDHFFPPIYKSAKKPVFFGPFEDRAKNKYCVADTLLPLSWQLINEKKIIEGFDCQKAKCIYLNRVFYAWYAPSIQAPFGPLRLGGLPGLILEAWDESFTYVYKTKSIKIPANDPIIIANPCKENEQLISGKKRNEIQMEDNKRGMDFLNSLPKKGQ